ncbi:hypothetical protein [Leptolyngbya sp. FACHB-261]|uniref:hypothetical protein n=1 Tax=Leptolyngbya sp. FACHB-261 TaxID=2692806 RepID=UPI001686E288|nr:hypothetical protein [Leptolyngbya sp. FACHB-261]MBD2105197.1 hypothetical protein [Leptolyngbya sp. FACHB-261]
MTALPCCQPEGLAAEDATSRMGMYMSQFAGHCSETGSGAADLRRYRNQFFEHFLYIATAMNNIAGEGIELWGAGIGAVVTRF